MSKDIIANKEAPILSVSELVKNLRWQECCRWNKFRG
jgi:hypothetical protein